MPRGAIARKVSADMSSGSWIREMFEKGGRLKARFGEQQVHDLSLGNPNAPPPPEFFAALSAVAGQREPALHRYMPNAGFPETRAAVARFLSSEHRLEFDPDGVILTSGAAGGMNVALRAILDPGDEVVLLAPFFPEYRSYVEQAQARPVIVQTDELFLPDIAAIERAIGPRTRALILNSPNNPSGAVYPEQSCRALAELLARHDRPQRPLYLLTDEPYRRLVYELDWCPSPARHYRRTLVVSSYSKELSIPGERVGYVALPPEIPERDQLRAALTMLNRCLGFVNAPAFMQRVVARCADRLCDVAFYRRNRDLLCGALRDYGYQFTVPGGALYVFPRTPIADDAAFVALLLKHRILAVPGRGFGRPGHMRLSFCVEPATIRRALPGLKRAIDEVR